DPYGYASAAELSLFRRPLPTTNLKFLSTVMWDGRETFAGTDHCNIPAEGGKCFASLHFDLADQSNGATQGHAQAPHPISDAPLDIGLADASRRTPDMPLYTFRQKCGAPGCPVRTVTDPGRALISGSFADIGKFKGPVLRGLAARAPYFHNGSAADLGAVVDFYNERFGAGIVGSDREDLIAFLRSL